MKRVFHLTETPDADPVEVERAYVESLYGPDIVTMAEKQGAVVAGTCLLQVTTVLEPDDKSTARALMHLSAAINHGSNAARNLPDVNGPHHRPAVRIRADVQYHLSDAGRSLGKAYDSLRTLAEIINQA